ncbi:amino acid ABC transporter permease [Paenibacillus aurantius]|uniref:Amino acid ABC transporter permease n=1 Tax=Paenibacillus aurantius TaxID=2918900 RepID=A0AA96LGY4_9BACL|nr:amino acid ABC transporter permease [Paenibacillus aurantius]WNQ13039.1 amino acid ABC transporter permease [Paenibacillus aurantius]
MDFSFLPEYYDYFLKGAQITIYLSIVTVVLGVLLGILLALMKMSEIKPFRWAATAYIEFIRGTPLLVQLFIIFYGLPQLSQFLEMPDFVAGALALSINSAAYVAEIFRAGIQAIDKGQMEAARSLGMSKRMAMRHIILPQAFKNILPALGNEFIVVIKESSIVMVIGIHELMYNANVVKGAIYRPFEPLVAAAILYFILTFTLSKLLGVAERRMRTE